MWFYLYVSRQLTIYISLQSPKVKSTEIYYDPFNVLSSIILNILTGYWSTFIPMLITSSFWLLLIIAIIIVNVSQLTGN